VSAQRESLSTNTQYGSARYKAWESWLREHGFPVAQVAVNGWVERDVEARTVAARVFAWVPGDEEGFTAVSHGHNQTRAYPNRPRGVIAYSYGDATLTYDESEDPRDAWMGTLTIQLDREPAPFPEVD
jgi:hypothetical protein